MLNKNNGNVLSANGLGSLSEPTGGKLDQQQFGSGNIDASEAMGLAASSVASPEQSNVSSAIDAFNPFYAQQGLAETAFNDQLKAILAEQYGDYGPSTDDDRTKFYEGLRLKPYTDSTGNATIGYGHKLTPEEIKSGIYKNGISKEQADMLYQKDKTNHISEFYNREPWAKTLPYAKRRALEDMAFNMGPAYLGKFPSARQNLQTGNYNKAAQQFLNSKYAKQVGNRANENAQLIAMY
jgi:lysozyme